MLTYNFLEVGREDDDASTSFWEVTIHDTPSDLFSNISANATIPSSLCKQILTYAIGYGIRAWDLGILVPNFLFFIFLLVNFRRARAKLQSSASPNSTALYLLVFSCTFINIIRSIIAFILSSLLQYNLSHLEIGDKILWLLSNFCLITVELSVLALALRFGHPDTKIGVRRVLGVALCVSVLYAVLESFLEFKYPDLRFMIHGNLATAKFFYFGHGGTLFWMIVSAIFVFIYAAALIFPITGFNKLLQVPVNRNFYFYCMGMALINLIQLVGTSLLLKDGNAGNKESSLCILDFTFYVYFALFLIVVYLAFLRAVFASSRPNLMFSYKPQQDEGETLPGGSGGYYPRFPGIYSPDYDDYLYAPDSFVDSMDLSNTPSLNPLYVDIEPITVDGNTGIETVGRTGGMLVLQNVDSELGIRQMLERDPKRDRSVVA